MKQMKQNYKIDLAALLLVGAASMMTAGAQTKPTLAVFVVGMQTDALGNSLAQQIGAELNRNSRYEVLLSTNAAVQAKLNELRTQGARNIDRSALAEWGREKGVSTICLVTDDIKGSDNMFYALLIDAKDSKVNGRGSYIRTGIATGDLPRVSLVLSRQLDGPGRRPSAPAPARSYPAELDIEMVFVEGGTFVMGCVPERDGTCKSEELPAHNVTLSSFYIGKYEVTQAQWMAVMGSNPSSNTTDDQLPVESVSWEDIVNAGGFLEKLNNLTGKNYRLPTEAEWEYAARDGKHQSSYMYSGSNDIGEIAWNVNNAGFKSHVVGGKKPNALGIYDMTGNVWELCSDRYSATYYKTISGGATNPQGPTSGSNNRMLRGGTWGYDVTPMCRNACREYDWITPTVRQSRAGLRVVLPAQ
jgi:formylglycine-generating enzyme required for sulfatase activity